MTLYRILFGIDALVAALLGWFFLWGLAGGSVSAFNTGLWLATLCGVGAVLSGGVALRRRGRLAPAKAVLLILAAPAALAGGFLVMLALVPGRWN